MSDEPQAQTYVAFVGALQGWFVCEPYDVVADAWRDALAASEPAIGSWSPAPPPPPLELTVYYYPSEGGPAPISINPAMIAAVHRVTPEWAAAKLRDPADREQAGFGPPPDPPV